MRNLDSFSSLPSGDDFYSGVEKGTEIVQTDSSYKQTSMIELPAIAINVAPLLPLVEALDLGTCSKYLNSLCECEGTWKEWYIRKWGPLAETSSNNNKGECSKNPSLNNKVEDIKKAIVRRQLADRQAFISWCIPKNTEDYQCYLPQEEYNKVCCLGDIMQEGMNMLYIFKESNIRANFKDISNVKVSSKIPESESESECDCAECRPDLSGGPSSS